MSIIKSHSVGNGDMFYIKHNSDNFTIIDCCLEYGSEKRIVDEILTVSAGKGITRFISTHPDQDHFTGLKYLDSRLGILNFYCVKNKASQLKNTEDFVKYCELRDSEKAFYIHKGCQRRWMNLDGDERKQSGIEILWADVDNHQFKEALQFAEEGGSPNNISAIIKYAVQDGASILWMGDLETDYMEEITSHVNLSEVAIIFAPHHGRDSGMLPQTWLDKLEPKIVILGEAEAEHLNYYTDYNTITQNSAGDIVLDCDQSTQVDIYVGNKDYRVSFLDNEHKGNAYGNYYLGTLHL